MNTEFKYNDNDYFLNEDEIGDSSVSDEPTEDSGVDDMRSQPSGAAGSRIGCGVIR